MFQHHRILETGLIETQFSTNIVTSIKISKKLDYLLRKTFSKAISNEN